MESITDIDTDEDPYQTDSGSNYSPSPKPESDDNSIELTENEESSSNGTRTKSRKRVKNEREWKVNKRKSLRVQGKEYIGHKNKVHRARNLIQFNHGCRYQCNKNFTEETRQELFDHFYKLPTYDHQTSYLSSCIKKVEVRRRNTPGNTKRSFSTHIVIMNKRVCKEFLLKTFDITNRRFTSVCKKTNHLQMCEPDKRGKGPSKRKMSDETRDVVMEHINKFPKYVSHYSRQDNANAKYLSSELTLKKMYDLYKADCESKNITPVKLSYYRFVFNTKFNLRFHRPHSDTCSRCDSYQNIIKHNQDESNISKTKKMLELHQRKAQKAIQCKKADIERYKGSEDTVVVCFDLQQTLPTPVLTTSKVFYLRQLWTFNFCIYDLSNEKPYMYVWNECIAERGSQEIGSCLLKFIKSLPISTKKIVAYSDSCGGQNKNKFICKLFMFLVKATHIEQIDHKFLEPGHTYMECDRAFGLIEKSKRKNPQVFIPEHWIDVIKLSSKNFVVHSMNKDDFLNFSNLNTMIGDPKKHCDNILVKFRDIQCFRYINTEEHFSFYFKSTLDEEFLFSKCVCRRTSSGRPCLDINRVLFPILSNDNSIKINTKKWKNLQTLLEFIPPVYHDFYKSIPHESKETTKKKKSTPTIIEPLVEEEEFPDDSILYSDNE